MLHQKFLLTQSHTLLCWILDKDDDIFNQIKGFLYF